MGNSAPAAKAAIAKGAKLPNIALSKGFPPKKAGGAVPSTFALVETRQNIQRVFLFVASLPVPFVVFRVWWGVHLGTTIQTCRGSERFALGFRANLDN